MSLCSTGLGEHVGELRKSGVAGRATGHSRGPAAACGLRTPHPDGRRGAGVITSSLQDGNPVPFALPLGIAWDAGTSRLVVVFLS